jgi:hypothetical protein
VCYDVLAATEPAVTTAALGGHHLRTQSMVAEKTPWKRVKLTRGLGTKEVNRTLSLGLAHVRCAAPEMPVYRTTPLSKFTFIARSSSARKIPDNYSIVRA